MLHLLQLVLTAILSALLFSIAITATTWHWVLRTFHGVIHELLTRFLSKRGTLRSAFSVLRFQMVRKLLQVLQYGETILQKPEEETQGQTIVFTLTSQIMEIVLTSRCVGVIFEWFHQLYPKPLSSLRLLSSPAITFVLYTSLLTWDPWKCWLKNLHIHGASFQHNLLIGQSE